MPEMLSTMHTERLDLLLMTPEFLEAALGGAQARAAQLLGVPILVDFWPLSGHIQLRLAQVRRGLRQTRPVLYTSERIGLGAQRSGKWRNVLVYGAYWGSLNIRSKRR